MTGYDETLAPGTQAKRKAAFTEAFKEATKPTTELDIESLARALWERWHRGTSMGDLREQVWRQDRADFLPLVEVACQDIERQGFQIVRRDSDG